ncbi:MAG TPA: FMN-binding protein [Acidimicrobiales bacterium]|nr:FMN-binding protein [Acidimicrobiales bacterium]
MTRVRTAPLAGAAALVGLAAVLVGHSLENGPARLGAAAPSGTGGGSGPGGSSPPAATTPPAASSKVSGSASGALEQYGYGELSVAVRAEGGKIVSVTVTKLLTADQYSQQIANEVIPMLRSEVLHAQSAQISAVSGATYTSEAYAASLQSALDKLHLK